MSDIVDRLRRWTHAVEAAPASDLMDEAAAEIERLLGSRVTDPMLKEKRAEGSAVLTDAEREAVEYFAAFHGSPREGDAQAAATLRGLLERLR